MLDLPLKMAAKVDPADRAYFERVVEPLLDHPLIDFVGEITDAQKSEFIGNAIGLVCPYDWPEPFGLVLIESLACGTPVLAYRRGSIPELIDHGSTGFISDNLNEMVSQVEKLGTIDRHRCRQVFDARFTAQRMTSDYVNIYQQLITDAATSPGSIGAATGFEPLSQGDLTLAEGPAWQTGHNPIPARRLRPAGDYWELAISGPVGRPSRLSDRRWIKQGRAALVCV